MKKVAINGLGRIGRAAMKIIVDETELELVAVNDLVPADNLAYLLKHDTVYGNYQKDVTYGQGALIIDGAEYKLFNKKDPAQLPWSDLGVDIVFECTGIFTKGEQLRKHIEAGAKRVILSAPAKDDETINVVYGVNTPDEPPQIMSCASCTTNCITPVAEVIARRIGVKKAVMTTIHGYTSTQGIVDGPNKKMRRGRAAACNLVPTSTGAAKATAKALPEYKGRFDGVAVRCPVPCGSIADIVFVAERETSVEEVNRILTEEANSERYEKALGVTDEELVSSDILQDPRGSIVDLTMTQVIDGDLIKVMSWYDNEWGYANQMIRAGLED